MAESKENKVHRSKVNQPTTVSNNDVIKIDLNFLNKIRGNPWMVVSFVLGILLVLSAIYGFRLNSGFESQNEVSTKIIDFLNSRVEGGVTLDSIDNKGSYYDLVVSYQGDQIPLKVTLDGDYLITDLVSVNGDVVDSGNVPDVQGDIEVDLGDSPVLGNKNAPVTIVEFSDFECPFCQSFYSGAYLEIKKNYVDTGKVKIVFKDFPLSFHPEAAPAAEAARCFRDQKGDEGFFDYHDKLFENQQVLGEQNYILWAIQLGADVDEFESCLTSGKYSQEVQQDFQYGSSLGVSGTPSFFINGKPLVGAQPYSVFEQVIDAELS